MQIIISPAKQMHPATDAFAPQRAPRFPRETERLHQALLDIERTEGPQGLQRLWSVSDRLLQENLELLHRFAPEEDADADRGAKDSEDSGRDAGRDGTAGASVVADAAAAACEGQGDADDASLRDANACREPSLAQLSPAAFSYAGIQYQHMAPQVMDEDSLAWLQDHLWILSGMYGCLRPFDAVRPYRLEMGAKLAVDGARNLYAFWGDKLARAVAGSGGETVVNLASVEYAKAVLPHLDPSTPIATCVFSSSLRNGRPVQKSTESKAARGSMVRWMAENRIESAADLKRFDVGFAFAPELSHEDGTRAAYVFMKR